MNDCFYKYLNDWVLSKETEEKETRTLKKGDRFEVINPFQLPAVKVDWVSNLDPDRSTIEKSEIFKKLYCKIRKIEEDTMRSIPKEMTENKKEIKEMKKSDLKNGMVVEWRNGGLYMVVNDVLVGCNGFDELCIFNDDLTFLDSDSSFDIVKVYQPKGSSDYSPRVWGRKETLIWERKEISEVDKKIQELEDKIKELKQTLKND